MQNRLTTSNVVNLPCTKPTIFGGGWNPTHRSVDVDVDLGDHIYFKSAHVDSTLLEAKDQCDTPKIVALVEPYSINLHIQKIGGQNLQEAPYNYYLHIIYIYM